MDQTNLGVEARTPKRVYLVEENLHIGYGKQIKITKARASELEAKGLIEW